MDVVEVVPASRSTRSPSAASPRCAGSSPGRRCACGPTTPSAGRCARPRTCRARRSTCATSTRRPGRSTSRAPSRGHPRAALRRDGAGPRLGRVGGDPVLRRPDQHRPGGHPAGPAAGPTWIYELDRAQNRHLRRAAPATLRSTSRRADARHGRGRPAGRRGPQLPGARAVRRQHGHPQMRAGTTCFLGVNVEGACSPSGTATTGRARARPAARPSRAR